MKYIKQFLLKSKKILDGSCNNNNERIVLFDKLHNYEGKYKSSVFLT